MTQPDPPSEWERILHRESRNAQLYLDIAEVIFVVINRNGEVVLINRKGLKVLGRTPEEIIGKNWFDHFLPASIRREVREVFNHLMAGAHPTSDYFENPVLTASGEERLIAWSNTVLKDDDGRTTGTLSSGQDITEKRAAEEKLSRSQKNLSAIVDTINEGIITIDRQGRIESFNRAATKIFGYVQEEVVGQNVSLLMPPREGDRHHQYIESYLATGNASVIGKGREVEGRRKDGSSVHLHLEVAEMRLPDGIRFVGSLRDLTEFKQIQDQLEQARVFSALGEMAASVAHEIRNPLAAIGGVAEVLCDAMSDEDDTHRQILTELRERVRKLNQTVRRLLDFTRPWRASRQAFNLRELVEDLVHTAQGEAVFENVRFTVVPGPEVTALLDLVLLPDVLRNLFYNAAEAMPEGGEIRIELTQDSQWARVLVTDTGPGIAPESLEKIFRPFFTTKVGGSGLGLPICKKMMDALEGTIEVRSTPRAGTRVELALPVPRKPAPGGPPEAPSS